MTGCNPLLAPNRGVTLIELMVVIVIMGLLIATALPLTSSWTNNARITEARGVLEQAIGRAKANALRNPVGVAGADAASAVCLTGQQVSLRQAQAVNQEASCAAGGANLWSASLPAGVTLSADGAVVTCLCFNNKAELLADAGACGGACTDSSTLVLTSGSENENVAVH